MPSVPCERVKGLHHASTSIALGTSSSHVFHLYGCERSFSVSTRTRPARIRQAKVVASLKTWRSNYKRRAHLTDGCRGSYGFVNPSTVIEGNIRISTEMKVGSDGGNASAANPDAEPVSIISSTDAGDTSKAIVLIVGMAAGVTAFWFSHMQSPPVRCLLGTVFALAIAGGGYKKKSLDISGAVSAFFVGWISCSASFAFGLTLIAFFVSSSVLTRVGPKVKRKTDQEFKEGGQRNVVQVLANGLVPTLVAALAGALAFPHQPVFGSNMHSWLPACVCAFVGYYACCCGDTWASEVGVLSKAPPRLITSFEVVPAGTNGGISLLGTIASAAGGLFVGMCYFTSSLYFHLSTPAASTDKILLMIPLGLGAGLVGSFIDSILGATIQFSGYDNIQDKITGSPGPNVEHISGLRILNNHAVNFVSALITSALAAAVGTALI
mmetsp:Transcript_37969/g.72791  ORF Transcript_37969/g.72791 Transcript_37969/m.72791 type:complete len:438 (+) Transcript_37969:122-1435(+)